MSTKQSSVLLIRYCESQSWDLVYSQVAKSDIITITSHDSKGGLDAYDRGDE